MAPAGPQRSTDAPIARVFDVDDLAGIPDPADGTPVPDPVQEGRGPTGSAPADSGF